MLCYPKKVLKAKIKARTRGFILSIFQFSKCITLSTTPTRVPMKDPGFFLSFTLTFLPQTLAAGKAVVHVFKRSRPISFWERERKILITKFFFKWASGRLNGILFSEQCLNSLVHLEQLSVRLMRSAGCNRVLWV